MAPPQSRLLLTKKVSSISNKKSSGASSLIQGSIRQESIETGSVWCSLKPTKQCNTLARYGSHGGGGYLMCDLGGDDILAIYSYGISRNDQWAADVDKALDAVSPDASIHEYDCTVEKSPLPEGTAVFHHECVNGFPFQKSPGPRGNVTHHLVENGHDSAPDCSLILKMDVEGGEFGAFASMDARTMQKFAQIVIEFHGLTPEADFDSESYRKWDIIRKIKGAGFDIVHVHENDCGDVYIDDQAVFFGSVPEATFVQTACIPGQIKNVDANSNCFVYDDALVHSNCGHAQNTAKICFDCPH